MKTKPELRMVLKVVDDGVTQVKMKNLRDGDVFYFGDDDFPSGRFTVVGMARRIPLEGSREPKLSLRDLILGNYTWGVIAKPLDNRDSA